MKIETKYNIHQEVWFMHSNKPRKDKVIKINFSYDSEKGRVKTVYTFKKVIDLQYIMDDMIEEQLIFATKKELISSL